jgi:hypothetical protein
MDPNCAAISYCLASTARVTGIHYPDALSRRRDIVLIK